MLGMEKLPKSIVTINKKMSAQNDGTRKLSCVSHRFVLY